MAGLYSAKAMRPWTLNNRPAAEFIVWVSIGPPSTNMNYSCNICRICRFTLKTSVLCYSRGNLSETGELRSAIKTCKTQIPAEKRIAPWLVRCGKNGKKVG